MRRAAQVVCLPISGPTPPPRGKYDEISPRCRPQARRAWGVDGAACAGGSGRAENRWTSGVDQRACRSGDPRVSSGQTLRRSAATGGPSNEAAVAVAPACVPACARRMRWLRFGRGPSPWRRTSYSQAARGALLLPALFDDAAAMFDRASSSTCRAVRHRRSDRVRPPLGRSSHVCIQPARTRRSAVGSAQLRLRMHFGTMEIRRSGAEVTEAHGQVTGPAGVAAAPHLPAGSSDRAIVVFARVRISKAPHW